MPQTNRWTVPRESRDELANRFAALAGAVDHADGFQGYELLKPTDDRDQWLVITQCKGGTQRHGGGPGVTT